MQGQAIGRPECEAIPRTHTNASLDSFRSRRSCSPRARWCSPGVVALIVAYLGLILALSLRAALEFSDCSSELRFLHLFGYRPSWKCEASRLVDVREYNFTASPTEVALQEASRLPNGIPRIIHQLWSSHLVPERYVAWMQSWTRHHPDWLHVFWTDEELHSFVRVNHPEHLSLYEGYPRDILRADMVRPLLLHSYGGLYADLDFEAKYAFDRELTHCAAYVLDPWYTYEYFQNSLMASIPGHPFWLHVMKLLHAREPGALPLDAGPIAMNVTGPLVLKDAARSWTGFLDPIVTRHDKPCESRAKNASVQNVPFEETVCKLFLRWCITKDVYHHGAHVWLWKAGHSNFVRWSQHLSVSFLGLVFCIHLIRSSCVGRRFQHPLE